MGNNFMKCGITGWCLEVLWTGIHGGVDNKKRMGNTSLLMFPIYGMAFVIKPVYQKIQHWNVVARGFLYTTGIFFTEYITGCALKKHNLCPWDYSKCKFNIKGVIRLDYAPAWFVTGLLFERIVKK